MISIDGIGHYSDAPGSQRFPFPYQLLYPDTGNFLNFVGDLRSRSLVRRCLETFRRSAKLPSEGLASLTEGRARAGVGTRGGRGRGARTRARCARRSGRAGRRR